MEFQHDAEYLCGFFDTLLALAGIELNFFMLPCMGLLCLGSVMKTVMISQRCFIYSFLSRAYTASRSFLLLNLIHYQGGQGCAKTGRKTILINFE